MMRKFVISLTVLMLCGFAYSQKEGNSNKVGIGLYNHSEGLLPSTSVEFSISRKISVELSFGMWMKKGDKFAFSPPQLALRSQYAGAIDLRYYFLFNRQNPLEGIAIVGHWGHYRSRIRGLENEYIGFKNFQSEIGGGFSGQYFFVPRMCLGATGLVSYVRATDYHLNSDGTIRFLGMRPGFVWLGFVQVGYNF